MVKYSNRKKAGVMVAGFLLLISLLAIWLYFNRKPFYPEVEEVTYLQVNLGKDTTAVQAGIRVRNLVPFSLQIDSVSYQIRSQGVKVGWGNQRNRQLLPALQDTVLNFRLLLDQGRSRKLLAQQQNRDSLEFDVEVQLYINPPLLKPQTISINRSLRMPVPKKPALQIDTFFVKSFSPETGYTFQLNLNTRNANLPGLEIENLQYHIRLADSILISGKLDSVIHIPEGAKTVAVPVQVKTAEMIDLIRLKLSKKSLWAYEAKASATLKTDHKIFENTAVSVAKAGILDSRKIGNEPMALPTVKKLENLKLVAKEKKTFLQANMLIHNPGPLPLYLDSARYFVRYKGKVVASGSNNFEKSLPAKGNQRLQLPLTVNNAQYGQMQAQTRDEKDIPLDVEMRFLYNLKGSKPQQIKVREKLNLLVTKQPSFKFEDINLRQLDPKLWAQLLVKIKINNPNPTSLQLDNFNYQMLLKNAIEITGKAPKPIHLDSGTTMVELPVALSGNHINQLTKNLVQGVESWDYAFTGTAAVTMPNSLLHQTEISLQTSGVYQIKSKGSPDFMPEISKIDTLNLTMHYDTAWVHMYAAIYNTLPATIRLTQLQVDVINDSKTIGKTEEKLELDLAPNSNSFAWHTLGVNYGLWAKQVEQHQHDDSILLNLPVSLFFELENLGKQKAELDLSTKIPTPVSPVTLLQRLKLRGFSFGEGLKFNALIAVQNANSAGLEIKNITYNITLENGVDLRGKIDRTYKIPLGVSEVQVPVNLSILEALKLLKRQLLGPPLLDFKINATANARTDNPKLSNVFVIFENWDQSDLKQEKTLKSIPAN